MDEKKETINNPNDRMHKNCAQYSPEKLELLSEKDIAKLINDLSYSQRELSKENEILKKGYPKSKVQLLYPDNGNMESTKKNLSQIESFSNGFANELSEPLKNIMGYANLSKKSKGLPPSVMEGLDKIVTSTMHVRMIVKQLLYFGNRIAPIKTKINLNNMIEEIIDLVQPELSSKGIDLILSLFPTLGDVYADNEQFKHVMINLIFNSIKAMSDGGLLCIKTTQLKESIILQVEDDGCGMDKEILEKMFIPFYSSGDNTNLGLGLSVVHGIVKSHNGVIRVSSRKDTGTKFQIELSIYDSKLVNKVIH